MRPFCSILLLHHNGIDIIDDCLTSLQEMNYPKDSYEVILLDNN